MGDEGRVLSQMASARSGQGESAPLLMQLKGMRQMPRDTLMCLRGPDKRGRGYLIKGPPFESAASEPLS